MHYEVDRLFLSGIDDLKEKSDFLNFHTDVIVQMKNGEKFVAAFFTFKRVDEILRENAKTGERLAGKYFWERNMLLVESCEPAFIQLVVEDLIEEGEFKDVFERI